MALVHIISSCDNDVFLTAHNLEKCVYKLYLRNEIMKTKQLMLESQKQMTLAAIPGSCWVDVVKTPQSLAMGMEIELGSFLNYYLQ